MKKLKAPLKVFVCVFILIVTVAGFNACSKDPQDNISSFYASLDGAHAIPVNTEIGTGYCNATYDSIDNQLAYTITWQDLTSTPTSVNFQVPDADSMLVNIPVTNNFSGNGVSGYLTIDQANESAIINSNFFVNISTTAHADGEIRGQLKKQQ